VAPLRLPFDWELHRRCESWRIEVTENDYALSVPEEATRRRRVVSKEASEGGESFGREIRKGILGEFGKECI